MRSRFLTLGSLTSPSFSFSSAPTGSENKIRAFLESNLLGVTGCATLEYARLRQISLDLKILARSLDPVGCLTPQLSAHIQKLTVSPSSSRAGKKSRRNALLGNQ